MGVNNCDKSETRIKELETYINDMSAALYNHYKRLDTMRNAGELEHDTYYSLLESARRIEI